MYIACEYTYDLCTKYSKLQVTQYSDRLKLLGYVRRINLTKQNKRRRRNVKNVFARESTAVISFRNISTHTHRVVKQ